MNEVIKSDKYSGIEISPDQLGNFEIEFWKAHNNHDKVGVVESLIKYNKDTTELKSVIS